MFKRFVRITLLLILALSLAACSSPATPTPDPTPVDTGKVETINNNVVDFEKNDIVIIKDYQGKYDNMLDPMLVDFGGDGTTYQIAIFGNVVNLNFWAGKEGSELFTVEVAEKLSNKLITFENAPAAGDGNVAGIGFTDANGERYDFSLATDAEHHGVMLIADSGMHSASVETGNILLSTHKGDGYILTVEASQNLQVQQEPVNYLYLQKEGQVKTLLTQSVDKGDDWAESVRNIFNPILSPETDTVYYVTDIESRASGAAAHNLFTRRIDLGTNEDQLLASGALVILMTDEIFDPYCGNLILKGHELQDGKIVDNYFVVTAEGETLCYLGTYLEMYEMDIAYQIEQAMK